MARNGSSGPLAITSVLPLPSQPIDATHALNLSAGVSNPSVLRGRSFSCRATHTPTERNRNKIRLLLARGWTNTRIAQALRNTSATLGKHYFRELHQRDEVLPALKAARCGDALSP